MKLQKIFWSVCLAVLVGGCAGGLQKGDGDPLESVNRKVLDFNLMLDRIALKPTARAYDKLPTPVKNGTGNFFSNLWIPFSVANDLLQGKFAQAGNDSGRFLINTILGAGGLMDVATPLGFPHHREDFGQTLAVWGIPSGPYLVLPLLGPSNLRDAVGLVPSYAADNLANLDSPAEEFSRGLRLVDARAGLLGLDATLALQPDQYLFLRESYRSQRELLIHDGSPPEGLDDLQLIDELLDED